MTPTPDPFQHPAAVASYTQDTPSKVPGLADVHRMTAILLSEGAPAAADILVVGAGGGLELSAMARARPDWRFTGVDPSPAMLDLARQMTAFCADRIELLVGTLDQCAHPLSDRVFDGATCLLTLHFLGRDERLELLTGIRRRLRPGARLVIAHHTAPGGAVQWLARSAGFANGTDAASAPSAAAAKVMAERLPLLSPEAEEDLLRTAGFAAPELFYAAFSFRGWVAVAA